MDTEWVLWEARRGQGELHENMGLDWTSKDGQNLNTWSGISLPNVVIQSLRPWCLKAVGGSLSVPRVAPSPRVPACREFSFSALEEELWLPLRQRSKGQHSPVVLQKVFLLPKEGFCVSTKCPLQAAFQSPGLLSPQP